MSDNPQIELARRYIEQTGVSLFLTGKAGTGKTTFLREVDEHTPKRHVVVAPTGVAAVNAGGVTIHSFFQLPLEPYLPDVKELVTEYQMPESRKTLNKNKLNIIRTLELLIIDEISMVRADLLDAVDMTLRRYRRSSRPFGGVQLLMIGDVHQLPPVVKEADRPFMDKVYPSPFFFHSKALQRMPYVTIELTKVYRQQDEHFVSLLNKVRNNQLDTDTLTALNSRLQAPGAPRQQHNPPITLTTHNYQADAINRSRMDALNGAQRCYEAIVEGNFPESMMPIDQSLTVKAGERVMFVKNDSSGGHRYYNGKLATVTDFVTKEGQEHIEVVDDDGDTIHVGRELWENLSYSINPQDNSISQKVDGTFCQYPLRPAWAVTIHKAQGLTFDRVSINAADAFAFGQVYVALSRCRTLEGLSLTTPLSAAVVRNDDDVAHFCDTQPTFEQATSALPQAEMQYYHEQLSDLFSMAALSADLDRFESHYAKIKNTYPNEYQTVLRLRGQLVDLASVSERFGQQLMRLPVEQHAGRIAKAAEYYGAQLAQIATELAPLLEVEVDNKETRNRLKEAGDALTERLGVKSACIKAVKEKGFSVQTVQKAKADCLLAANGNKADLRRRSTKERKGQPSEPTQKDLVEMIRLWRRQRAEELEVPPYTVLQQKALLAIAAAMPSSMAELKELNGVGPVTIERYGGELLALVADYREYYGVK